MNDPIYRIFENTQFNPKYRLVKYLGSGQFGAVFLADEVVANNWVRSVALKAIRGDRAPLDRMVQELQIATSLSHDYLLRCYTSEQGQLNHPTIGQIDCLGLVMEVANGTLTEHWENSQRQLPVAEVEDIVFSIASALVFLHSNRNPQGRPIIHQVILN